jgi:amino acid transporter
MWGLSLGLSFAHLIMLDILLYGASLVLEFSALVVLRIKEPNMPRPFRVPGGTLGACLLGVAPTALLIIALVKNYDERFPLGRLGSISSLAVAAVLAGAGVLYYFVAGRPKPEAAAAGS